MPTAPVDVTIIFPPDNSQVPGGGTFETYGYCEPPNTINRTARVRYADGTEVSGVEVGAPPPYNWKFLFKGVRTEVWCSLIVCCTHPITADTDCESHAIFCLP
jgi:hypothetical protein